MMKKILIILMALILFSCEDFLVEKPKSIAVETFYNTKTEIEAAVAAAYAPLREYNTLGFVYISLIECFADYQTGRGSWLDNSNFQGLNGTNIGRISGTWGTLYLSIRNANLVIMNAPEATDLSEGEIAEAIGEAKFIRAFTYFILVKSWGGVPIRTEANFDELSIGRSSEEDVYQLIIDDLEDAETNLPDVAPVAGRASKWAAKTLLADVYFYRGMYNEAAAKSNEVVATNKYSLVPVSSVDDYQNIFGADVVTTSEEVFYIKHNHDLQGNSYTVMLHHSGAGYCGAGGWYGIHSDKESFPIMKNWDQNDLRSQLWYNWNIGLGPNSLLTLKFIDPGAPNWQQCGNDIPVYRYGDVLLLNAEASCRASGSVSATAVERLNMVHRRAYGYNPLSPSSVDFNAADYNKDSFIDLVMMERCYETMCEGKRWFDLKRLGATKLKEIILANRGKVVADKHLLFPIPDSEFSYNEALDPATDQNPGY